MSFCINCGAKLVGGEKLCLKCGNGVDKTVSTDKYSASAMTAFILGLFSLFYFCSIFGPVAGAASIVFSIIGICRTGRGRSRGRCFAVSGLAVSVIALLFSAATAFGIYYIVTNFEAYFNEYVESLNIDDYTDPLENMIRFFSIFM